MAAQGATLQNYNNELVKSIEDLREKREELNKQILKEEEDKGKVGNGVRLEGGGCRILVAYGSIRKEDHSREE